MTIPDFQTVMLPLLQICGDAKEHTNQETYERLADQFSLSDEDRSKLLPSGRQTIFTNRVAWAKSHMRMALLLENVRRGAFHITPRGLDLLATKPVRIDLKTLAGYPEYQVNRTGSGPEAELIPEKVVSTDLTPHELLETAYQSIRKDLAANVLSQVKACPPDFFERLVVDLLLKMGYGGTHKDAGRAIGKSGDGGIDGIIKEDKLGLDTIYLQAKRWEQNVGQPEIQQFVGALEGVKARRGIFLTTSTFTRQAREYADKIERRVVLIDGESIAELMIDHGVGVSTTGTFEIKRIDGDYFSLD